MPSKPPEALLARLPAIARIAAMAIALVLVWLPFAVPIYRWVEDPGAVSIASMTILYAEFVMLSWFWGRRVWGEARPFRRYGVVWSGQSAIELVRGLGLGWAIVIFVFSVQTALGWVAWPGLADASLDRLLGLLLEGGALAIAVGCAEEFLFRGWMWDELRRDYRSAIALPLNAGIFAALHYIRPLERILATLPQFFGLFVLGLLLGWMKEIGRDRLGGAIGLHSGLVWAYYLVSAGSLVRYTGAVPEWLTGLDGNPLAGLLGLSVLGAVGVVLAQRARSVAMSSNL
ncbi:MAG: type II CAAX prenyl endopeptidase Rce1 family protein [Geitlerinemataceae cyanobacterium]